MEISHVSGENVQKAYAGFIVSISFYIFDINLKLLSSWRHSPTEMVNISFLPILSRQFWMLLFPSS